MQVYLTHTIIMKSKIKKELVQENSAGEEEIEFPEKDEEAEESQEVEEAEHDQEMSQLEVGDCIDEQPNIALNAIAQPLADDKLSKRLYKLIKKSAAKKNKLCRGLKNVQTRIRKGGKGLCILAGDVTPIDIYCHLPIVCEDKEIPYCFVSSKKDIAAAIGAKRPCIVALVETDDDYKDLYDKCYSKLAKISC